MSHSPSPAAPPETADELLLRFDDAWQSKPAPRIEDYLPAAPAVGGVPRRQVLEELVKIDLEYRCQRSAGSPRVEDYLRRFPELESESALLELLGQEYEARLSWSDRPEHAEYQRRYPRLGPKLQGMLRRVDAKLAREFGRPSLPRPAPPLTQPVAVDGAEQDGPFPSVAGLAQALAATKILSPSQLHSLGPEIFQARSTGAGDLAEDLVRRGWLTAFQAKQALRGRTADLVIGQYLLLDRLGEGGTGQVYRARHRVMNRAVAIKVIRPELLADAEVVARFYREMELIGQLSHPHIIHGFDAGPVGPVHLLVMEYSEGIDLSRLVKQEGPLPWEQACDYIRQAALGLQHAFERDLVHRDIKPTNLLVKRTKAGQQREDGKAPSPTVSRLTEGSRWGLVKILDFGLARLQRHDDGSSRTLVTPAGAIMMGTPDFLAPEQATDFHGADIRADIYGLGCTLYYLLTGRPLFPGGSLAEKLVKHMLAEPPPLAGVRPDVPPGLEAVLRRLLAKRPEDRFQTPAAVVQALGEVALDMPPTPVATAAGVANAAANDRTIPSSWEFSALLPEGNEVARRRKRAEWRRLWLRVGAGVGGAVLAVSLGLLGFLGLLAFLLGSQDRPPGKPPAPDSAPPGVKGPAPVAVPVPGGAIFDDFSGGLGAWQASNAELRDGAVHFHGPPLSTGAINRDISGFTGDFTVRADFTIAPYPAGVIWSSYLILYFDVNKVELKNTSPVDIWVFSGPTGHWGQGPGKDTAGKGTAGLEGLTQTLKIRRTGDTFNFSVTQAGNETVLATKRCAALGALTRVRMSFWTHGARLDATVDNFRLEAGRHD